MITTTIRQRVQDNLNRNDPAQSWQSSVTTKIQGWINDTKREIELRKNMDSMRKFNKTQTITNGSSSVAISAFTSALKDILSVQYRKTLPTEDLSWTPLPRVSEMEVARIQSYDSPGVVTTGTPAGWELDSAGLLQIYPAPLAGDTYQLYIIWYEFSADFTYGVNEEPYLAAWGYQALIYGATALGFRWAGQLTDSQTWMQHFERALSEFIANENRKSLEGEMTLKPHAGAMDPRPARWRGWQV